jgi:thiosulfate/3-mercaptopyruvate sulfurtransferase
MANAYSSSPSSLIAAKDIPLVDGIVIIDARSGPDAFERYRVNHLSGALHVDLDRDLSEKPKDPAFGGRHPLPDPKRFAQLLGKLGITTSSRVVVYDDKNAANAAARFWWMLRALGHEQVQVVDGGLDAVVRARLPMSSVVPEPAATSPYPGQEWILPTRSLDDVATAVKNPEEAVIDVREAYRYKGESEPIDLVAGHIPGAINVPYLDNLKSDGTFKSPEELKKMYAEALKTRDISSVTVHCGSGVTACHTLLALEHAGLTGANLYVGSWSEWSRRNLPIATGEK